MCDHEFCLVPYANVYVAGNCLDRIMRCDKCGMPKRETIGSADYLGKEFRELVAAFEGREPARNVPEPTMEAIRDSIRRILRK